jgi:hypothetical protein
MRSERANQGYLFHVLLRDVGLPLILLILWYFVCGGERVYADAIRLLPNLEPTCSYLALNDSGTALAACRSRRKNREKMQTLVFVGADNQKHSFAPAGIGSGPFLVKGFSNSDEVLLETKARSSCRRRRCSYKVKINAAPVFLPLIQVSMSNDGRRACGTRSISTSKCILFDLKTGRRSNPLAHRGDSSRFSCKRINDAGMLVGQIASETESPRPAFLDQQGRIFTPSIVDEEFVQFAPVLNDHGDTLQVAYQEPGFGQIAVEVLLRGAQGELLPVYSANRVTSPLAAIHEPVFLNDHRVVVTQLGLGTREAAPTAFVWAPNVGLKSLPDLFPSLPERLFHVVDLNNRDELLVCATDDKHCWVLDLSSVLSNISLR